MSDRLEPVQQLNVGQAISSPNGKYTLVLQGDGNLVGYQPGGAFWDSGTWTLPPHLRPVSAVMQDDGNFRLWSPNGPVWETGTAHGASRLMMQDDRNIVIYKVDGSGATWASNTVYVSAPEIPIFKKEYVGHGKEMKVEGFLYRDGRLVTSVFTKNDNWTGGMRGRALAVVVDGGGHAIWVSQAFEATTRCSIPDVSCASYGQQTWVEQYPAPVGKYAERVDVFLADKESFVDLRAQIMEGIKAAGDIAQEVKEVLDQLF